MLSQTVAMEPVKLFAYKHNKAKGTLSGRATFTPNEGPLETLMVREDLTTTAPQLHGLLPSSAENEQPWGTDPVGLSLLLKLQQCGASASRTSFETSLPCLSEVGASFVSLLLFLSCFLKLGHPGTSA